MEDDVTQTGNQGFSFLPECKYEFINCSSIIKLVWTSEQYATLQCYYLFFHILHCYCTNILLKYDSMIFRWDNCFIFLSYLFGNSLLADFFSDKSCFVCQNNTSCQKSVYVLVPLVLEVTVYENGEHNPVIYFGAWCVNLWNRYFFTKFCLTITFHRNDPLLGKIIISTDLHWTCLPPVSNWILSRWQTAFHLLTHPSWYPVHMVPGTSMVGRKGTCLMICCLAVKCNRESPEEVNQSNGMTLNSQGESHLNVLTVADTLSVCHLWIKYWNWELSWGQLCHQWGHQKIALMTTCCSTIDGKVCIITPWFHWDISYQGKYLLINSHVTIYIKLLYFGDWYQAILFTKFLLPCHSSGVRLQ